MKFFSSKKYYAFLIAFVLISLGLVGYPTYQIFTASNSNSSYYEITDADRRLNQLQHVREKVPSLFNSEVMTLSVTLLEQSTKIEREVSQHSIVKYNYAIPITTNDEELEDQIMVAAWNGNDYKSNLLYEQVDSDGCMEDGTGMAEVLRTDNLDNLGIAPESMYMINIYPESNVAGLTRGPGSPCWVLLPAGETVGLLDGSSKHLMLAQGESTKLRELSLDTWKAAKVKAAGEVVVNLNDCKYTITNNSGTFKPSVEELERVAEIFARVLRRDGTPIPPHYFHSRDRAGFIENNQRGENATELNC